MKEKELSINPWDMVEREQKRASGKSERKRASRRVRAGGSEPERERERAGESEWDRASGRERLEEKIINKERSSINLSWHK